MASVLAWLDNDDAQRESMRQLIELFKDESTVDELGIGSIRDTIANHLFPGTSVLQTRARYLLFVAWLLHEVARHRVPSDQALQRLRSGEVKLIDALLAGGETEGVIGAQARSKLKNMPSGAYWAGMGRFGVRTWDLSIANHFRAVAGKIDVRNGDPDDQFHGGPDLGIDPALPAAPEELLSSTTFGLSRDEALYLQGRIAQSCPGTLFAWLAVHGDPSDMDNIWEHDQLHDFPPEHQALVDHGRRFHHAIHGAPLVYNLMLAEKRDDSELVDAYLEEIDWWRADLRDHKVFRRWDITDFWKSLTSLNPRIHPATTRFVNEWFSLAQGSGDIARNPEARRLVAAREQRLKGGRSRLVNAAALDAWTGRSGLVRLDYRWRVASRHLHDIYAGLDVA